jgi:hypothetical protein
MTDSSELHHLKHDLQIISTEDGIMIDFRPEEQNAYSSIRCNLEPFSNITDSSDLHQ